MNWIKENLPAAMMFAALIVVVSAQTVQISYVEEKVDDLKTVMVEEAAAKKSAEEILKGLNIEDRKTFDKQVDMAIARYVQTRSKANEPKARKEFKLASDSAEGNVYGNPDAKIAIIEYSDFDCPFCKRFHPTPKKIADNSDGNVKWVYKHFPLDSIHPVARKKAIASECVSELAGNKAFWAYADEMVGNRNADIVGAAQELGVDAQALSDCMASPEMQAAVQQSLDEGKGFGITGTPASIVMNTETGDAVLVPGAVGEAQILQVIQQVLAKSNEQVAQN